MKTYPIKTDKGSIHVFEVGNAALSRGGVVRIVQKIPNVVVVKKPKFLSWLREDVFCQFEISGQLFSVEEPFGDNSRYLVSAEPRGSSQQIEVVERAFKEA